MNPKVIVIGLDGATWDLLKPWAEKGFLPTFKKLLSSGTWGELESTVPAITFPAWECLFTGQNPGKLGVFDFTRVEGNKIEVNTPNDFKGIPLWNVLNAHGYKACVINVPTSKVEEIYGAMVGGPFCDEGEVFPPELTPVLKKLGYEQYPTELTKVFMTHSNSPPPLELIRKTISSRFKLARYLIEKEEPDFLALVIFVIDNLQHFYWGEPILLEAWKAIDAEIGKFVSEFKGSTFVLVSDHGFTEYRKTFYTSKFLESEGLASYRVPPSFKILKKVNQSTLINFARKTKIEKLLFRFFSKELIQKVLFSFPSEEGRIGVKGLEKLIDWEKSKCIPLGDSIYLTDESIKEKLREKLMKLGLVKNVYFREEVYRGEWVEHAPNIIIEPREGVRILDTPLASSVISERVGKWKGVHKTQGIVLFYGPEIKPSRMNAKIYDVAPTILSFFGAKSSSMDGKILFTEEQNA